MPYNQYFSVLGPGESLRPGERIISTNGNVEFKLHDDGRLAVHRHDNKETTYVFENTAAQRSDVWELKVEENGNVVL